MSVTSHDCHHDVRAPAPTNALKVVTSPGPEGRKVDNFTVCMKPVVLNYSRAYEVVEFIEMNRLLGASKFQVYVTDPAPNVLKVLRWW